MIEFQTLTIEKESVDNVEDLVLDSYVVKNLFIGNNLISIVLEQVIYISVDTVIFQKHCFVGINVSANIRNSLKVLEEKIDNQENIFDVIRFMEFMAL